MTISLRNILKTITGRQLGFDNGGALVLNKNNGSQIIIDGDPSVAGQPVLVPVYDQTTQSLMAGGVAVGALGLQQFTPYQFANGAVLANGVHDDTAAIQAAANAAVAAHGVLVFPPPAVGGWWNITSTITFGSATETLPPSLDISAKGLAFNDIRWGGASGTSGSSKIMFSCYLKRCRIEGVKVSVAFTHDIVVWDLDTTATNGTIGQITFDNCQVSLGTGINTEGYRLGYNSLDGGDVSFITFINTYSFATLTPAGSHGWTLAGGNCFVINWVGCGSAFCAVGWSTIGETGAAAGSGGGSDFFWGCGATGNLIDFQFDTTASYSIYGGRFETGARFLETSNTGSINVTVRDVEIDSYNNGSNAIISMGGGGSLLWDNCRVTGPTPANSNLCILSNGAGGSAIFRGGQIAASDPFFNIGSGTWDVEIDKVGILSGGIISGYFSSLQADSSGSPGAATQNVSRGRAAIAIGALSCVITNALVTANSQILVTLESVDTTLTFLRAAAPGAGAFTVTGNANATAAAKFSYSIF